MKKFGLLMSVALGLVLLYQNQSSVGSPLPIFELDSKDCADRGSSLVCDPGMSGNLVIAHPNVDFLRSPTQPRTEKYAIFPLRPGRTQSFWRVGPWWSSFPLIEKSSVQGGQRLMRIERGPEMDRRLMNWFFGRTRALNPPPGPGMYEAALGAAVGASSRTQAILVNPINRTYSKQVFGDISFIQETFPEYFGLGQSEADVAKKLKGLTGPRLVDRLKPMLIRNESGMRDTISGNGDPCSVLDETFKPGQDVVSNFCKHLHLGISSTSARPVNLRKESFRLAFEYRVIADPDSSINALLKSSGFSSFANHAMIRLSVQRKRTRPLRYWSVRANAYKVKDRDQIAASFALFKWDFFCVNPEFRKRSAYCAGRQPGSDIYNQLSTIASRPDYGTFQFMYKFGLDDLMGKNKALTHVSRVSAGQWVRVEITDIPRFSMALRAASQECLANHKRYGVPREICDIESFDLKDYEITGLNMGMETSGIFRTAYQVRRLQYESGPRQ